MRLPTRSFVFVGLFLVSLLFLCTPAALAGGDPGEELRAAATAGDEAKVRALLDAGAPVDAAARHGRTALLNATLKGHFGVVKLLVERGASVKVRGQFFGDKPIDGALEHGNLDMVRFLLERGAEGAVDVLFVAIQRDDVGLAKLALELGRIEPLDLAAARKEAAAAPSPLSPALQELLAKAVAVPREFPPYSPVAERVALQVGKFQNRDASQVVMVERSGKGLRVKMPGDAPALQVEPVEEDRYDTSDGKVSVQFGGRGGIIERIFINREGDVLFLGKAPADEPVLLKTAGSQATPEPQIPDASAAEEQGRGKTIVARPWPQFRGSGSSGVADGQGAPFSWNLEKGEGLRFKTPIPGLALASPIIWGDRIYIATAVPKEGKNEFNNDKYHDMKPVEDRDEHSFRLYALDTRGQIVWEREVFRGPPGALRHIKSSQANSTPVTDGEKVVVLFGAVGKLATFNKDGKLLWQVELGPLDSTDPPSGTVGWGHASSPILVGRQVIVQADLHRNGFLASFDLDSGKELWRTPRQDLSSWATPNVIRSAAGEELVVNATTIRGYDAQNGKELWRLGPNSEVVVSTPQIGEDLIYVTAGYPPVRPVYAIRPGQRGDLSLPAGTSTSASIAWSHQRGGTYIPSPILYRGYFHTCNNNGIFATYDAKKGDLLSTQRLSQSGMAVTASLLAADGRIFVFTEDGTALVLSSGPEPALLGTYTVGEPVMATPAISGGLMVVRTLDHVIGIESGTGR